MVVSILRTEQLDYLCTISECPSLTEAAKRLYITTPALSTAIKTLEDELGIQLLHRYPKGIALSEDGKKVIKFYRRFINDVHSLKNSTSTENISQYDLTAPLDIHINVGSIISIIVQYVCELYADFPSLQLTMQEHSFKDLSENILSGNYEFGLSNIPLVNGKKVFDYQDDLVFHHLLDSSLVCLVHKHHPINRYQSISLRSLIKYPCNIWKPLSADCWSLIDILKTVINVENITKISNIKVFYQMSLSNNAVGIIPHIFLLADIQHLSSDFIVIPINDDIVFSYGYFISKNTVLSQNSKVFLQQISSLIASHNDKF